MSIASDIYRAYCAANKTRFIDAKEQLKTLDYKVTKGLLEVIERDTQYYN